MLESRVQMLVDLLRAPGRAYLRRVAARDAARQRPRATNERAVEYGFGLSQLAAHRPTTVLDVGTGKTAWPHLLHGCGYVVTAIDNVRDYWPRGMVNRHWPILDVDVTDPKDFVGPFDAVTCLSVLEHIPNHLKAMQTMHDWLRPGGLLVLTCPFAAVYDPDVYKRPDATMQRPKDTYICQSYSPVELAQWRALGFTLKASQYWRMFTGPVWRTGEPGPWEMTAEPGQLGCFALVRD